MTRIHSRSSLFDLTHCVSVVLGPTCDESCACRDVELSVSTLPDSSTVTVHLDGADSKRSIGVIHAEGE